MTHLERELLLTVAECIRDKALHEMQSILNTRWRPDDKAMNDFLNHEADLCDRLEKLIAEVKASQPSR